MKLFKYCGSWTEFIIACETKKEAITKIKNALSKSDLENWDDEIDIPDIKELPMNSVIAIHTS